ncbi:MAG: nucleoside hydrolase [Anaerolineaceae bacterium]|nr:nucleoside hydrolase [Anaerolineaceae bacterium]
MKRLVIDCDPGVDDAQAILMAYMHPDAHIEAITTVAGNVGLEHTTANALKILDILQADNIPVYAGADGALIERVPDASEIHGKDGLGDVGIPESSRKPEKEHAVNALIRLANENPGELDLIAIGPLTNLALATRLDPDLPKKYKSLHIMGGTIYGQGNTKNTTAEFNIYADPDGASVVFDTWDNLTMISWETTMHHGIPLDKLSALLDHDTSRGEFVFKITQKVRKFLTEILKRDTTFAADPLAMAVALEPDIVLKSAKHYVHVERMGRASRGMTVVDWFHYSGHEAKTNIILEVDHERFHQLLESIVK